MCSCGGLLAGQRGAGGVRLREQVLYEIPATAKDAAGNTLHYDETRKAWGYIIWTQWTSAAPGGTAVPENAFWSPFVASGTLTLPDGTVVAVEANLTNQTAAGMIANASCCGVPTSPFIPDRTAIDLLGYLEGQSMSVFFKPPINDAVLMFAAMGSGPGNGNAVGGPWTFSEPFEPMAPGHRAAYAGSTVGTPPSQIKVAQSIFC